ncbi:hypothetical protein CU669_14820 [Paramagnetospirillum kuznetsovii]|uniref:Uncharacterized protein n=1 Tax=Paramagnetospirillum kuznetsovii TaxID=2053833 RepID=A0A364NWB9_9PROT|nr:hypothetical protein [Paramagnetospirillum kuznetsovii]RAU21217.1 hypothetical protein CU669_14820 [Paramagnetospirillum kuznetsovii]
MIKPQHLAGQFIAYSAFAVMIAYFASSPPYQHHPQESALVRLSLTHAGQRVGDCKERSPDELAKLPPNMRAKQNCGRERNQVTLEMDIDGKTVYSQTAKPAGLSGDGRSRFYDSREVPAGRHVIRARMRDGGKPDGFDYDEQVEVELAPRQVFVIDFDEEDKKLSFE